MDEANKVLIEDIAHRQRVLTMALWGAAADGDSMNERDWQALAVVSALIGGDMEKAFDLAPVTR